MFLNMTPTPLLVIWNKNVGFDNLADFTVMQCSVSIHCSLRYDKQSAISKSDRLLRNF